MQPISYAADNLRAGFKVTEGAAFGHQKMQSDGPACLKTVSSDNASEYGTSAIDGAQC